jgi:sulfur-carrier protein adenylyltransferase/sulfurtransferase
MFSKEELERYSRHFVLQGFGKEAQEKLKHASVLVIGAGGLGAPLLQYLTAAGVGKIGIADFDKVSLSNLQRQVLFNSDSIDKLKSTSSIKVLKKLNANVNFEVFSDRLTSTNALEIVRKFDVIADGTDNFPTRYLINDAAVIANKPLVYGSVHGFEGQCSVFNFNGGPNYRDLHPIPPNPDSVPNCAEGGVIGALPGIIGSMMAVEAIKLAAKLVPGLAGKLYLFDSLHYYNQKINLPIADPKNRVSQLIDYEEFCSTKSDITEIINNINSSTLKEWLAKLPEVTHLIDVRESNERLVSNIGGIHIPLASILEQSHKVPTKGNVIFYCSGGVRSAYAIEQLSGHPNFENFYNLENGLKDWNL